MFSGAMSAIAQLLLVARIYREATDLKPVTLSWQLFGDSKKLERLERGFDIQVTRYERAMQWLSDHWPANATWPEDDVKRPAPAQPEAVA